jgi:hypothetical protein
MKALLSKHHRKIATLSMEPHVAIRNVNFLLTSASVGMKETPAAQA